MEGKDVPTRERRLKGVSCRVPTRYTFAALTMVNLLTGLMSFTFPAVALPSMIRRKVIETSRNITGDVCMFREAQEDIFSNETKGEFEWDEMVQSYVMTLNSVGMIPSMILAGRLVEIWSPKHLFLISSLINVVLNFVFPITARWSVNALIVSQFVAGLAMGAPVPAISTMMSSWFPPEERQTLAGIVFSAQSLGTIVSNAITGKIVDTLGWEYTFYIIPSLPLVWSLLWWFLVYDTPNQHPSISEEELTYIVESTNKDQSQTTSRLPWKEMLTSPPVWAHVTMALAPSWIVYTYSVDLPTYLNNILNYSSTKAGYFLPIPQFFYWASFIASGILSQWLQKKRYVGQLMSYYIFNGIVTLGSAACLIAVTLVGCNEAAIQILLVAALACSGAYMGGSQLNHMDLAINYAGTLGGVQAAVDVAGSFIAPVVNGIVTDKHQTLTAWNKVFYIAAAVNVFIFVVYLIFGSVDEQPWNRPATENDENKSHKNVSEVSTVYLED